MSLTIRTTSDPAIDGSWLPSRSRSATSPASASRAPITATYGILRRAPARIRAPSEPSSDLGPQSGLDALAGERRRPRRPGRR